MNTKNFIAVLLIAMLVFTACAQAPTTPAPGSSTPSAPVAAEKQTVKIGVSIPLSGSGAFMGEGVRNAVDLALSEHSDAKYKYVAIYEDDQMNAKMASTTAQKLITSDGVDAIISFSSGTGNVIAPIAQESKILHIGMASDANVAKGSYNYIHWTPPAMEAKKWAEEASKRGYKRVALLGLNHPGIVAVNDAVKTELAAKGIAYDEELLNAGTTDFKTAILKMEGKKPDAYLLMFFSPELELAFKQMKDQKVKGAISSIETFEVSEKPATYEGLWYVNAAEAGNVFNEKYTAKYAKSPVIGTSNAYDAANMIVWAYENAGTDASAKPSSEQALVVMDSMKDLSSSMGPLSMGADGIILSQAAVKTIKDGKFVVLG